MVVALAAGLATTVPMAAPALDLDGSGTSDVHEARHGGPMPPWEDADGDGRPNRWELFWGCDPRSADDAGSRVSLEVAPIGTVGTAALRLRWTAAVGSRFALVGTGDLHEWSRLGEPIEAGAPEVVIDLGGDVADALGRWFLAVHPLDPLDRDGDGLDAVEEAVLGTSDQDPDSDGDGRADPLEWVEGGDAVVADGEAEPAPEEVSGPMPVTGLEVFLPLPVSRP